MASYFEEYCKPEEEFIPSMKEYEETRNGRMYGGLVSDFKYAKIAGIFELMPPTGQRLGGATESARALFEAAQGELIAQGEEPLPKWVEFSRKYIPATDANGNMIIKTKTNLQLLKKSELHKTFKTYMDSDAQGDTAQERFINTQQEFSRKYGVILELTALFKKDSTVVRPQSKSTGQRSAASAGQQPSRQQLHGAGSSEGQQMVQQPRSAASNSGSNSGRGMQPLDSINSQRLIQNNSSNTAHPVQQQQLTAANPSAGLGRQLALTSDGDSVIVSGDAFSAMALAAIEKGGVRNITFAQTVNHGGSHTVNHGGTHTHTTATGGTNTLNNGSSSASGLSIADILDHLKQWKEQSDTRWQAYTQKDDARWQASAQKDEQRDDLLRTAIKERNAGSQKQQQQQQHGTRRNLEDDFDGESPLRHDSNGLDGISSVDQLSKETRLALAQKLFDGLTSEEVAAMIGGDSSNSQLLGGIKDLLENTVLVLQEIKEGTLAVPEVEKTSLESLVKENPGIKLSDLMGGKIFTIGECYVLCYYSDFGEYVEDADRIPELMSKQSFSFGTSHSLFFYYNEGNEVVIEVHSKTIDEAGDALEFVLSEVCTKIGLKRCTIESSGLNCAPIPVTAQALKEIVSTGLHFILQFHKVKLDAPQTKALTHSKNVALAFESCDIGVLEEHLFSGNNKLMLTFKRHVPSLSVLQDRIDCLKTLGLVEFDTHRLKGGTEELRTLVSAAGQHGCAIWLCDITENQKDLKPRFRSNWTDDVEGIFSFPIAQSDSFGEEFQHAQRPSNSAWSESIIDTPPGRSRIGSAEAERLGLDKKVSAKKDLSPAKAPAPTNIWNAPAVAYKCQVCFVGASSLSTGKCAVCGAVFGDWGCSCSTVNSGSITGCTKCSKPRPNNYVPLPSSTASISGSPAAETTNQDDSTTNTDKTETGDHVEVGLTGWQNNIGSNANAGKAETGGEGFSSSVKDGSTMTTDKTETGDRGSSSSNSGEDGPAETNQGGSTMDADGQVLHQAKGHRTIMLLPNKQILFTNYPQKNKSFLLAVGHQHEFENGCTVELLESGHLLYKPLDGLAVEATVPNSAKSTQFWCGTCKNSAVNGAACHNHCLEE